MRPSRKADSDGPVDGNERHAEGRDSDVGEEEEGEQRTRNILVKDPASGQKPGNTFLRNTIFLNILFSSKNN